MLRFFFCIFVCSFLFADPEIPSIVATLEGEPSCFIGDTVGAIMGEAIMAQDDIVVEGAEPIRLRRIYSSYSTDNGYSGWLFFPNTYMKAVVRHKKVESVEVPLPTGGGLYFNSPRKIDDGREKMYVDIGDHAIGFTNSACSLVSGQTNIKNHYIIYKKKKVVEKKEKHNNIHLYTPDGGERKYCYYDGDSQSHIVHSYRLEWERLPNGNKIIYKYHKDKRLFQVSTTNPSETKTYAWVKFHYNHRNDQLHKNKSFRVETSDGRWINYNFSYVEKEKKHYLSNVTGHTPFPDTYAYHGIVKDRKGTHFPRAKQRIINNSRILEIEYYLPGKVNGLDIRDLGYDHIGKVAALHGPAGPNGEDIPLYRFYYQCGKVRGNDHGLRKDGRTDIVDADGNMAVFHYTKHLRPTAIVQHHLQNSVQVADRLIRFSWGREDARNIGNLEIKSLHYPDNTLASRCTYIYDDRGNPLTEEFFDNVSNQKYTKKYAVPDRGFNLITYQEEDNGKITHYTYYPGTNRLLMRLTGDKTRLYKREFFEYNADHILVKETVDDGTSHNPGDLAGVSIRKIKTISPKQQLPAQNLPEVIEEKYFDGSREVLLNKTVIQYNNYAWVIQKDLYDANNTFRYSIHYKHDSFGRVIEETDPSGRIKQYDYDAQGNQTLINDPSGRFSTYISYNPMHHPVRVEVKTKDGKSRVTTHRYDAKGNKISTTDLFGNTTFHTYDAYGHLLTTTYPDRSTETRTYDIFGNVTSLTDPNGHTTSTTYNALSKPLTVTYADGTVEQNIYNPDGSLKTSIDALGTKTHYTYDTLGRILTKETADTDQREQFSYNGFEMTRFTDASGAITTFKYDKAGRKIEESKGDRSTSFTYDTLGRLHKTISGETVNIKKYDLLDRIVEERTEDTQEQILSKTTFVYDTAGNQTEITTYAEAGPITHLSDYDDLGRIIASTDPEGHTTHITYIEDRCLQKITTDPLNVSTIETYDSQNRLASLEKRSPSNDLLSQETFTYDPAGNLIQQKSLIIPTGTTVTVSRVYDSMNRLIQLIEADGTPEQKTTQFTYLVKSLKDKITKPNGTVIEHTYDALGRLKSICSTDGTCYYAYSYDPLHRPITVTDLISNTTSQRSYNIYGEVIEEFFPNGYSLQKSYDHLGRKILLVLPDRSTISYTFDSLHLKSVSRNDYTHTYDSYDLSGHLTQSRLIKDLGTYTFRYDPSGRLLSHTNPFFTEVIDSRDDCGHITQVSSSETTRFTYDHLYQLSSENSPLFQHTYLHDSHHNRLKKNEQAISLNALNQISTLSYDLNGNLTDSSDLHFTYDGFDRLTQLIKDKTIAYHYTYDCWHRRLSQITYLWHQNQWQEYQTVFFLYDGDNEIGTLDTSGNITHLRILGQGLGAEIGAAIALELHGRLFAPIHDYRGNIVALASPDTHTAVEQYRYSAFGEETIFNPSPVPVSRYDNPWRFASKYTDSYTHLVFFGRRHYDPASGRWITPDPQGYIDSPNLYAFVLNDPLARLDLYGLVPDYFPIKPKDTEFDYSGFVRFGQGVSTAACYASKGVGWTISTTSHHLVPIPGIRNALISAGNLFQGQVGWHKDHHSFIGSTGETPLSEVLGNPNPIHYIHLNGMGTSPEEVHQRMTEISNTKYNGARLNYAYNANHGTVSDTLESLGSLLGISSHSERQTIKFIKEEYAKNPNAIFILEEFSQGSITGNNATNKLPACIRKQIYHFSMGGAKIIPRDRFAHADNYISRYDPIPLINPFAYIQGLISNQGHVQFMQGNTPLLDHSYNSPPYQDAQQDISDFIYTKFGTK